MSLLAPPNTRLKLPAPVLNESVATSSSGVLGFHL